MIHIELFSPSLEEWCWGYMWVWWSHLIHHQCFILCLFCEYQCRFQSILLAVWILPVIFTHSGLVWSYSCKWSYKLCPVLHLVLAPFELAHCKLVYHLLQSILHTCPRLIVLHPCSPNKLYQYCTLVLALYYLGWWNNSNRPHHVACWSWSKFPNHLGDKK